MASKFDAIAGKPAAAKTSSSSKLAAEVTPAIKEKVDLFVNNKAQIKRLEAEQKDVETEIINHVRAQQDANAYAGNFSKSYLVAGSTCEVTYVTSDRFSVPQEEETLTEVKKLVGKKYDEFFEVRRSITMKKGVVENEKLLDKIATACEKAGLSLGEIFDVGDKVFAKDSLDEKQYSIPAAKLDMWRALVRQNKPALK